MITPANSKDPVYRLRLQSIAFILMMALSSALISCQSASDTSVSSPSGEITVDFQLNKGKAEYTVDYAGKRLIDPSILGFEFRKMPALDGPFKIASTETGTFDQTWQTVWGHRDTIRNHYNELIVELQETESPNRSFSLHFKVYDDGLGFRYTLPQQQNIDSVFVTRENTQFVLSEPATSWWIPANYNSYEKTYRTTPLSEVDSVNTPITMKTESGTYVSLHEADLTDYAGMTLFRPDTLQATLQSRLVPWTDGDKVKTTLPMKSPWRTIQISDQPGGLVESDMIVNLNRPNKLDDTSWIKPMNYIGIWWHYHIRTHTWWQGENHGATTERMKEYIDFASEHNIGGVLAEGWNQGWGRNEKISFTTPYDDYDLEELARYADEKGVHLIGHNETRGNIPNYESQVDSTFKLYESLGIHAVKTGYAGKMVPEGTYKHGQRMVNHYRMIVKKAAEHKIMINAHEPIKPTGIRRTWPNMVTREGVRGMEFNAWSEGNPPEHTTILPFTRMLGGPLDYTPGIFDVKIENFAEKRRVSKKMQKNTRVHTTRAKQLALYPILFSPLQMAADLIENYQGEPEFTFIEQVPSTWHETRVVNAEIGDHVTIARQHDREWFIGSITDEKARSFEITLDFLEPETDYRLIRYADAEGTDWKNNPTAVRIDTMQITGGQTMKIELPAGGGQAMKLAPLR